MKFDANRLLELSGIAPEDQGVLSESAQKKDSKVVNEGSDPDRLVETKLRAAIRGEIKSILQDLEKSGGDTAWMHRSIGQPQTSKPGRVTRGFLGLGFK